MKEHTLYEWALSDRGRLNGFGIVFSLCVFGFSCTVYIIHNQFMRSSSLLRLIIIRYHINVNKKDFDSKMTFAFIKKQNKQFKQTRERWYKTKWIQFCSYIIKKRYSEKSSTTCRDHQDALHRSDSHYTFL